jgi:hypothetical protein
MKLRVWGRAVNAIIAGLLVFVLPASAFAGGSWSGILPLKTTGSMPAPLAGPTITMSNYNLTVGQTATVTFTFPAAPLGFTASDTSATNGTISNLASTSDPDVYTATFTPTPNTNVSSNVISVAGKVIGSTYTDPHFDGPFGIAFDGTNMWVTEANTSYISKITPTGTVTDYTGFDGPDAIAFDGTNMWVANFGSSGGVGSGNGTTVMKVGPSGSIIGSAIMVGKGPTGIAFDGSNMWSSNYGDGVGSSTVSEISSTGVVTLTASTTMGASFIAFDGTNMWVADYGNFAIGTSTTVTKVSPIGSTTDYTGTDLGPTAIAFDGTNMWTANYGSFSGPPLFSFQNNSNSVTKITPSGAMTTYKGIVSAPGAIAYDGTNMWTANYFVGGVTYGNSISEISPTGTVTNYTGVGIAPSGIAFDGTNMWVASQVDFLNGHGSVTKVTGTIAPSTSANYVVDTVPPSNAGTTGGGSILNQVETLSGMGNTKAAQAIESQWPNLFSSTTSSTTTPPVAAPPVIAIPLPAPVTNTTASSSIVFTRYLQRGMTDKEVRALQQYLNSHGFTIAATGPGSSGQEGSYFGTLTYKALVKFQNANAAEILTPYHLSSGTGVLGPATIAFIVAHQQ